MSMRIQKSPPDRGPVAQWSELAAHNRLVGGSSPPGPTNDFLLSFQSLAAGICASLLRRSKISRISDVGARHRVRYVPGMPTIPFDLSELAGHASGPHGGHRLGSYLPGNAPLRNAWSGIKGPNANASEGRLGPKRSRYERPNANVLWGLRRSGNGL